jgi:Carboxypeptidase regulatory-like domain/TonB dependent receptor/TonB-dependent Receptor Plug Domain
MGVGKSKKLSVSFAILLTVFFSLIAGVVAHAQVTGATLAGTVTDPSGGVVVGAAVSAKNTATGVVRDATTDSAGIFSLPNLTPGDYEVKVSATGFSTAVQSNLSLAVGQQQQLNFTMKVGETSTTVQVSEAAPQVELTSSTLTGQVESETVRELPLDGRDWTSLATLQPGVNRIETQMSYDTSARGNRGFGTELTVSGQRSTFNNYRIDGIGVTDYAMAAPGNVIGVVLGVDSIQEFSVLTGGFSAEYGRATGGVVNAISKSGTNSFHGDAYEFLRNSALDANDYFTKSAGNPRPPFRRNQFGVSAGGPIIKDRLFIFGDYEGLRQGKGIPTSVKVPSDNARNGTLTYTQDLTKPNNNAPAGCTIVNATTCTVTLNNYAKAILNGMFPHANAGLSPTANVEQFVFAGLQTVPENFYTVRVDYKLGNSDNLFGTYLYDDTDYTQPDKMNTVINNSHTTRTTIALEETHTFGANLVNAARIGYNRNHVLNAIPLSAVAGFGGADLALGSTTGQNSPRVTVTGLNDTFGGVGANSHYFHTWNSYQLYDDAFWTHGAHTIKFGGGIEWMPYNFQAFQEPGGRWKFGSLSNFLQGVPNSFEAGLPPTVDTRQFRQTLYAAYVQDDWKMKSNLTFNIGLRYEMTTVLKDGLGRIGSLQTIIDPNPLSTAPSDLRCQVNAPGFPGIAAQPGTTCDSTGPYYKNPTLHNFEPRLGFAWDPFKDGKTSVRGGFGIYDVLPLAGYFLLQENQAAPYMIFKSITGNALRTGTSFGSDPFEAHQGESILENSTASKLSASTIETNPHRSYVMQWNLNVQRQLMSDTTLTLGYVGSRGVHLLQRGDDGNMTQPTFVPGVGYLFPCGFVAAADTACTPGTAGGTLGAGGATSARVNQALGVIRYIYWGTDSNYNALNVNLVKQMKHGFQAQLAYSFAKSLDDNSQSIAGDSFGNAINSPIWSIPRAYRGPSDFNVTHSLSLNGLWDLPTPKSWEGVLKTALGGWELGNIVKINSGVPTSALIGDDPLGLGNSGADQHGFLSTVPGCDPINHGYVGSDPGSPLWIKSSCYTLPSVPTASLGSLPYPCAPFASPAVTPAAGQTLCSNLLGNTGRNTINGPRFFSWDLSVLKNFPITKISESFAIQFRAEMFNVTNHDNFVPPQPGSGDGNSLLYGADGSNNGVGIISALGSDPREIQFALKVVW